MQPGATLGAYRIVELIGRGGMATVYKAFDPALDRHVAIKVLPDFYAEDAGFRQRFKQEAITAARLRHPNILTVFASGEDGGTLFLVTELITGGTLADRLGGPLPLEDALRILLPISSALDYAHGEGVLHRDIKPSNILITDRGAPILADFGLARLIDTQIHLTRTGQMVGTPAYMAPEYVAGTAVGAAADRYALAVVAYEMLTGRVPFSANTPLAVLLAHLNKPLPPPRSANPDLSEAVEGALLKGLAKDPDERFPSALAFAESLAASLGSRGQSLIVQSGIPATLAGTLAAHSPLTVPLPEAAAARHSPVTPHVLSEALPDGQPDGSLPATVTLPDPDLAAQHALTAPLPTPPPATPAREGATRGVAARAAPSWGAIRGRIGPLPVPALAAAAVVALAAIALLLALHGGGGGGGYAMAQQHSGTTQELRAVVFADALHGWAVSADGTILRTTDGGATWSAKQSRAMNGLSDLSFPDATHGWAVGAAGAILHTADGGATWMTQPTTVSKNLLGVAFPDAGHGWAVGAAGTILHTTDGGARWRAQHSGSKRTLDSAVFRDGKQGWALGDHGVILHTANAGSLWSAQHSGVTLRLAGASFADASHGWAVGAAGTILHTTDGGATWTAQRSGVKVNLNRVVAVSATEGWVVGEGGTLLHTVDGGTTWAALQSGVTQALTGLAFAGADHGWAVGAGGLILRITH